MYYQYELTHFEGDMGHGVASDVGIVNLDAEEHQNRAAMLCTRVYLHT